MIKSISKTLLTGFITLLPIVLTIYLLYWLAVSSENVMGGMLRWILPDATSPASVWLPDCWWFF
jgi:uncharacterized membrane protein